MISLTIIPENWRCNILKQIITILETWIWTIILVYKIVQYGGFKMDNYMISWDKSPCNLGMSWWNRAGTEIHVPKIQQLKDHRLYVMSNLRLAKIVAFYLEDFISYSEIRCAYHFMTQRVCTCWFCWEMKDTNQSLERQENLEKSNQHLYKGQDYVHNLGISKCGKWCSITFNIFDGPSLNTFCVYVSVCVF